VASFEEVKSDLNNKKDDIVVEIERLKNYLADVTPDRDVLNERYSEMLSQYREE
jgi:hypothetical protein